MKKINFKPSFLQILYFVIYLILFFFIIITPMLIKGSLAVTEEFIVDEEIVEGVLLGVSFFLSIVILNLYRREVKKQKDQVKKINHDKKITEKKLLDSFDYIGQINVQIQEIKSIFNEIDKYPETRNDFKKTLCFLSERVLGIVNVNWVLFRIINGQSQKTISEHLETRQGFACAYPHISNKMMVEKKFASSLTAVISAPENLNIIVGCVLPAAKINNDQRIFLQAIINEITMMFIILNSSYYKNENEIFAKNNFDKSKK